MVTFFRVGISLLLVGAPLLGTATEPLVSPIRIGEHEGIVFPEKPGSMDLPRTPALREARLAQRCSALGGPVGRFEVSDDRIWLVGLYRCGGNFASEEIYPEMRGPVVADWLNGSFKAPLDFQCHALWGPRVYKHTARFEVRDGVVSGLRFEANDDSICEGRRSENAVR